MSFVRILSYAIVSASVDYHNLHLSIAQCANSERAFVDTCDVNVNIGNDYIYVFIPPVNFK